MSTDKTNEVMERGQTKMAENKQIRALRRWCYSTVWITIYSPSCFFLFFFSKWIRLFLSMKSN